LPHYIQSTKIINLLYVFVLKLNNMLESLKKASAKPSFLTEV